MSAHPFGRPRRPQRDTDADTTLLLALGLFVAATAFVVVILPYLPHQPVACVATTRTVR